MRSPGPDRGAPRGERPDAVIIRTATWEDAEALIELLQAGALGTTQEDPVDLAPYRTALSEIEGTPGSDVLVAERDGLVVGTCQLITFRHLQHRGGRCAEIESMHVAPDLRGTGIGSLLLEAALEFARDAGCYRVQLTSNAARSDAHRFYERHGFVGSHVGFKRLLESPA